MTALWKSRLLAAAMVAAAIAPALLIIGCEDDSSGSSAAPAAPVVLEAGRTLLGGGWVNDWCWVPEDLLRGQIHAMAQAGWDAYIIEMGGAARWDGHSEEEARAVIAECYPVLVDMLADEGMVLLNSVQNDNSGEGKFSDRSPPLSAQAEFSAWLVNLVAAVARPDVVMVQPVAETKTAAGFALEDLCAAVLTNFTLVNNAGSRPDQTPSWAAYDATHPWSIETINGEDLVVGDTSPFIIEVDGDGDMAGWTSPDQVRRAYAACRAAGALFFGLYLFDAGEVPAIDYDTIRGVPE